MKFSFLLLIALAIISCNNSNTASAKQAIADSAKRAQDSIANIIKTQQEEINKLQDEKKIDEQLEIENQKQSLLSHIHEYLKTFPDVKIGLGGFTNGKVHLKNETKISFQKVTVLVKVILANGNVYTADFITFENIDSGEIKTISIPDSSRGEKVEVKVVKVKSDILTNGVLIDV